MNAFRRTPPDDHHRTARRLRTRGVAGGGGSSPSCSRCSARAGLGWNLYQSTQMMSFVDAWVAVVASVVVSLMVYSAVSRAGRRIAWW